MACQQPDREKVTSRAAVAESCIPSVTRVWMTSVIQLSHASRNLEHCGPPRLHHTQARERRRKRADALLALPPLVSSVESMVCEAFAILGTAI
jgi:hypothetical protein